MRPLLSLIRREFTAYFLSPIAYAVAAFLLLITGMQFTQAVGLMTEPGSTGAEFPMQVLFGDEKFWLVFLFIPPILTMRLLAEERGSGTIEMLLTAPIRDWQVVLGKYIGCLLFYIVLWIPTLAYIPVLVNLDWKTWTAGVDPNPVIASYIGMLCAGAMFLAIGLYVSSLVKNQLVAAVCTMPVTLFFTAAAFVPLSPDVSSFWNRLVYFVSVPEHFRRDFCRGILDTRHLILYLSVAAIALFLTVRSLDARRR